MILAIPSFRDRIPVLVDRVTTLTGPGELIDVIDGRLHIDGDQLEATWEGPTLPDASWPVPDGHAFVLGDARVHSVDDSRTLGPIPLTTLQWRVAWRYWPPRRVGGI